MLEVQQIDVSYGDLQALWGASLKVEAGEIAVLIGPNGAGKTTLMRAVAGLQPPSRGQILLEDAPIEHLAPHSIVARGVVLIPEGRRLFGGMSVLENLWLGAFPAAARAHRDYTLERVFSLFPILRERQGQAAGTLSGGQQQMVAIGRALMGLPRLLLLDEPSLGLAPIIVRDIFRVLREINEAGVTVLLAEQNAQMALEMADRAFILEQGRVAGEGTGEELLHSEHVRTAYLGQLAVGPS